MTETATENTGNAWWDWDSDGPTVTGTFVKAGKGHTVNGPRPFVVLDVDGAGERTIWLHHKVLRLAFAREVKRRQIEVGERIQLRQVGARDGANGRSYVNYEAEFFDAPPVSQAEIFGPAEDDEPAAADTQEATTENQSANGEPDGDIPF